jgi:predicted GH43/DUF377 family glycosyl hydrolase
VGDAEFHMPNLTHVIGETGSVRSRGRPTVQIDHADLILAPEPGRTVIRPFSPGYPAGFDGPGTNRAQRIANLAMAYDDDLIHFVVGRLDESLGNQHRNFEAVLLSRFQEVNGSLIECGDVSRERAIVIGAFFSEEYSFEAAALFNPTMVLHPNQSGMHEDEFRFIMALRGMGEGHLSSVTFRTGVWRGASDVRIDTPSPYSVAPEVDTPEEERADNPVRLSTPQSHDLSETVLFPILKSQVGGIEDMRLVRFTNDDGTTTYHGTFTAFSGVGIRSEMLSTDDFSNFVMTPLRGSAATGKGMALFPRRIGGDYVMLGRQDNESIWLHRSDDLFSWSGGDKLISPKFAWDAAQMGNCGSPIEIDEGWLVVTHGVGPVRSYSIGAALLDRDDPGRVLGRVAHPVLVPAPEERDGYVPNVVYSCGGLVRGRRLMLPYGVADNYTKFASIPLDSLLAAIQ